MHRSASFILRWFTSAMFLLLLLGVQGVKLLHVHTDKTELATAKKIGHNESSHNAQISSVNCEICEFDFLRESLPENFISFDPPLFLHHSFTSAQYSSPDVTKYNFVNRRGPPSAELVA